MKPILYSIILSVFLMSCGGSNISPDDLATQNPIVTTIDLTQVVDDKAPVTINPGRFTQDTVIYRLPRIIQGSYEADNFGKYIDNLKAIDYKGNLLSVEKIDDNSWQIVNATQLDKLEYYVNDTYDLEIRGGIGDEFPFSPGGTNISPDNYVLNLHGFIGYFDSLKTAQYQLDVTAPANIVRTSALQNTNIKSSSDGTKITTSYFAPRYFDITDNPMMYGKLDVEEFLVDDIKIVLSVYSPNQKHSAASLKETVVKMMEAQKSYLGDIHSTTRYDIYLFLSDGSEGSPKGMGALEHHTSTIVVLRENVSEESLARSVIDIVAHEFFHIVTPLSVHSEDIHYFDYNDPTFSKHLWMYEGVTEYFAQHFQVYEGLVTPEEYYKVVNSEINRSKRYDDAMSFTEMSENILDEPYKQNYSNVYQKGALIGMCMDILMREESNGNRSMLTLMKELSTKYGKDKPFDDDTIIDEIVAMTYPSIGDFLNTHVIGSTPIDYSKFLEKVGLTFAEINYETNYIQAGNRFIFDVDQENEKIFFSQNVSDNTFWAEQNVQSGDIIKSLNGTILNLANARSLMRQMYQWKVGDDMEMVITRNGEDITIKTTLTPAYTIIKNVVENPEATEAQIAIRNAWLKG